jgi:transposase
MLLGHWLEMRSVMGASEALEAPVRLLPAEAHRLGPDGWVEEVPADALRAGDRVAASPCWPGSCNELKTEYGVHATQINTWKKLALAAIPQAFSRQKEKGQQSQQAEIDELHRQIGQLVAERDWLKKKSSAIPWRPEKP